MDCPCGTEMSLDECCGPLLDGKAHAPSAEALMRSRYSAYVLQKTSYIIETHHADSRGELDEKAVTNWAQQAEWLGLEIVTTDGGGKGDDEGLVEFIARYQDGREKIHTHHEKATFRKKDDRWYFHDGELIKAQSFRREQPKVGRNEPCPCGSGKKHKKCCARPGAST